MLFDLRGRGRRRTIQGIYLLLALLIGGGLIFFGVGTGSSGGGLLNAVGSNSGGANGLTVYNNNIRAAQRQILAAPNNPAGWLSLAQSKYALALAADYDQTTQSFTSKGKAMISQAQQAWDHYLALNPKQPDSGIAAEMARAFVAINALGDATRAQEIVANANPTSYAQFATLAEYAYFAGQSDKGDLAAAKAVSLAPKAQQKQIKQSLAQLKTSAQNATAQQATQQLSGGGAHLPTG